MEISLPKKVNKICQKCFSYFSQRRDVLGFGAFVLRVYFNKKIKDRMGRRTRMTFYIRYLYFTKRWKFAFKRIAENLVGICYSLHYSNYLHTLEKVKSAYKEQENCQKNVWLSIFSPAIFKDASNSSDFLIKNNFEGILE